MAAPRSLQDESQPESSRHCASGWVLWSDATRLVGSIQDRGADGLRQDEGEVDPPTISARKLSRGARVWPPPMPNEASVIHTPCPPAGRRSHQAGFPIQASTEYGERGCWGSSARHFSPIRDAADRQIMPSGPSFCRRSVVVVQNRQLSLPAPLITAAISSRTCASRLTDGPRTRRGWWPPADARGNRSGNKSPSIGCGRVSASRGPIRGRR